MRPVPRSPDPNRGEVRLPFPGISIKIGNTMTNKLKIGLWFVFVAALVIFGVYRFWWGGKLVPGNFAQLRIDGAKVADNIARLSSVSLGSLEAISKYDKEKKFEEALKLVEDELTRNREARQEAFKLSNYLDQMARLLEEIRPRRARDLATQALGQEVNLINRLIVRNDLLEQLFGVLKIKFEGKSQNSEERIKILVSNINEEAIAINRLNKHLNLTMEKFDALTLPRH